jgi:hypothetical protein
MHGRDDSQIRSARFSIFNTKCLEDPLLDPGEAIVTENLRRILRHEDERTFTQFLFGQSKDLTQNSYVEAFRSHLSHHKSQRVILLGYDINNALCALRNSGFDFPLEFPPSTSIIDLKSLGRTQGISHQPADDNTVRTLLRRLIPKSAIPKHLSSAGNMAHALLKCVLMLAVHAFQDNNAGEYPCSFGLKRVSALEAIGRASIEEKLRNPTPDWLTYLQKIKEEKAAQRLASEVKKKRREEQQVRSLDDVLEGGINAAWDLE